MPIFTKQRAISVGYRISRLSRATAKLGDRIFPATGLSRGQIPVFMEVLHEAGRSQKELSDVLHIDTAATARTLHTLETAGLVKRLENPECRRDKCVHPTPKAEDLLPGLLETLDQYNEMLLSGFTNEERTAALRILDRLVQNAERAMTCQDQNK